MNTWNCWRWLLTFYHCLGEIWDCLMRHGWGPAFEWWEGRWDAQGFFGLTWPLQKRVVCYSTRPLFELNYPKKGFNWNWLIVFYEFLGGWQPALHDRDCFRWLRGACAKTIWEFMGSDLKDRGSFALFWMNQFCDWNILEGIPPLEKKKLIPKPTG